MCELSNLNIIGLAGNIVDAEAISIFKFLINHLGGKCQTNFDSSEFPTDFRSYYTFFNTLNYYKSSVISMFLLVSCYPRYEAPILNIRLRKNVVKGNSLIFSIGFSNFLTYPAVKLGQGTSPIINIMEGRNILTKFFKNLDNLFLIMGLNNLQRKDGFNWTKIISFFKSKFKFTNFNILNISPSRLIGSELGLENKPINKLTNNKKNFIYLLDVDDVNFNVSDSTFIIYQGHHCDKMAYKANMILPGSLPYEKRGLFINLDGLIQRISPVFNPPKEARNDWRILVAIYSYIFKLNIKFKKFIIMNIYRISPIDTIILLSFKIINLFKMIQNTDNRNNLFRLISSPSQRFFEDFYLDSSLTRSSPIMTLSSRRFNMINLNFQ